MLEITSVSQFHSLKSSSLLIIDFYAIWCGPCKMISPIYEKIAAEHASSTSVVFAKCDVDKAKDVSKICGISAMPTFQFYGHGKKLDEIKGMNPQVLRDKTNKYISSMARNETNTALGPSSSAESLRDLIDADASKLMGASNLSSVRNIVSPPPAGYAIASIPSNSQVLIHVVFSTLVQPESLVISMMKDSTSSAPSRVEVGSNVPVTRQQAHGEEGNDLVMDSLEKADNVQSFTIFSDNYVDGTATLKLKASKFANAKSLTIRVDANLSGDSSTETIIGKIDITGTKA